MNIESTEKSSYKVHTLVLYQDYKALLESIIAGNWEIHTLYVSLTN